MYASTMVGSEFRWPFPDKFGLPWRFTSAATRLGVMLAMKALVRGGQKIQVKNLDILQKATLSRPKGTPLVTVSNHASCLDDPAVWALFPTLTAVNSFKIRWIPAAQEMCFSNKVFSAFFSRGQLVPVVRGDGVYQRGINFCIQRLNEGNWIHVFPEGKVNMTEGPLRLKWGVGRIIAEAKSIPTIIPFWHVGMEDMLPNYAPYIPRLFKKLTVLVGEPIDIGGLLKSHAELSSNAVLVRKQITDVLQNKLYDLRTHAEELHKSWTTSSLVAYRTL